MKQKIRLGLGGLGGLGIAGLLMSFTLSQRFELDQQAMGEKLEYSQQLLEAIILEDFKAAERIADELRIISELSNWNVLRTPEYARLSSEFRRVASRLAVAAKDSNLDGLTLGYVELVLQCFQCHNYMRGVPATAEVSHVPARSATSVP